MAVGLIAVRVRTELWCCLAEPCRRKRLNECEDSHAAGYSSGLEDGGLEIAGGQHDDSEALNECPGGTLERVLDERGEGRRCTSGCLPVRCGAIGRR